MCNPLLNLSAAPHFNRVNCAQDCITTKSFRHSWWVFGVVKQCRISLVPLGLLTDKHFRANSCESTDCSCGHLAPDSFLFPRGELSSRTADFKCFFLLQYRGKNWRTVSLLVTFTSLQGLVVSGSVTFDKCKVIWQPHDTGYTMWNKSNKMQQLRFYSSQWLLLYMFRATISPIIRSTYAVYGHR